jgi:hypothetical protein
LVVRLGFADHQRNTAKCGAHVLASKRNLVSNKGFCYIWFCRPPSRFLFREKNMIHITPKAQAGFREHAAAAVEAPRFRIIISGYG